MGKLPKVIATSVIRSSHKGESHGGLYLIDLETSETEQVIDWNRMDINWEGRGMDRGMRGIAIDGDRLYVAISDEILIYNRKFIREGSIGNPYLRHCHEICIEDGRLYMTSTGFDSILVYDLPKMQFTDGYCLRFPPFAKKLNKLCLRKNLDWNFLRPIPSLHRFDPNSDSGPSPGDSVHINNIHARDGELFVSGTHLGIIVRISGEAARLHSYLPYFTHNARPYQNGVIANITRRSRVAILDRKKNELESFHIPLYDPGKLTHNHLPEDYARQGFGRGLCCHGDMIIAGSSPATISVFRSGSPLPIRSVNITMDVRNAIHGLEVWEEPVHHKGQPL